MVDEVTAALMDAIEMLKKQPPSREVSLAITRAEEAYLWWRHAQNLDMRGRCDL